MKNTKLSLIEIILYIIIAIVVVVLITGSVYGIVGKTREKKLALEAVPNNVSSISPIYSDLGRIRAQTNDKDPAVVVLSIVFPYDGSRQFWEELQTQNSAIKKAVINFFTSKSKKELQESSEDVIKASIRDIINSMLHLGQIEELYFPEYSVIN